VAVTGQGHGRGDGRGPGEGRGPGRAPVALVLRALGLGDLLTGVPALRALRRGLPEHEIVLAAPAPIGALLPMIGAVDRLHPLPGLEPFRPPGPRPGLAVDLHGSGPRSHELLTRLNPGRLLAFAHPDFPDPGAPPWRPDEHEVSRWCRLVAAYGFAPDPADLSLLPPAQRSPAPGAVILHPGAKYGARRWPPERFAAVATLLRAAGHRVVLTGQPDEADLARSVARAAGVPAGDVLAGRTDLGKLAALVAHARLVVSNDTGIAHLATAFGTASVVIFGPMAPSLWGPPPGRPQHVALWAGQRGSPFAAEPHPGLLQITVPDVMAGIRTALATGGACPGPPVPAGQGATRPARQEAMQGEGRP
jgi:ADP-heptose:LPS heptosyltransferase